MNLNQMDPEVIVPLSDSDVPEGIDPGIWKVWMDDAERDKDPFLAQLKRAKEGQNIGLENGLATVNKYIHGTHKARYYLVAGESSAGKTTIADFMFVISAWFDAKAKGKKIKIKYFSFEIGKLEKQYRWISYIIFYLFKVSLPSDYLQGRVRGRTISDQHENMVLQAYAVLQDMMQDIDIIETVFNPTDIFNGLTDDEHGWFGKNGTMVRTPSSEKNKRGNLLGYVENDPNLVTIIVIDHLALTGEESGKQLKGSMDAMSKYAIVLRNLFRATVVFIQQFSPDMQSTYRGLIGKKTEVDIIPQRIDFGDSKATFRDADVVLGLVKPQVHISNYHGIDVSEKGLGDYFTVMFLMKHRQGPCANRRFPLFVDGLTGWVYDLPLSISNGEYNEWYQKATEIDKINTQFEPL